MSTGIVFDIQRFTLRDGPGIRTTVFLKGCPLHCPWCLNPEARRGDPELAYLVNRCIACGVCARVCPNHAVLLEAGQPHIQRDRCVICGDCAEACVSRALVLTGKEMTVEEIMVEVRKDRAYYQKTGGGLTASGGEPTQQIDFLVELLQAAKNEGIHTCLETNGCADQKRQERILPLADLILYDYKATGPAYQELIGVPESLILENLDYLYQRGANMILRCPMVPGVNDNHEHLKAIARLERTYPNLAGIEILPYQNTYTSKFERYGYVNPLPNHPAAEEWHRQSWMAELESLEARRITIPF